MGLQGAGEAEAVAAGALRLAVHLARHPHGPPAVGHARAPPYQLVVLHAAKSSMLMMSGSSMLIT